MASTSFHVPDATPADTDKGEVVDGAPNTTRPEIPGWSAVGEVEGASSDQRAATETSTWGGTAQTYDWTGEFGEVGPEVPELEKLLFGGNHGVRRGEHIEALDALVTVEGPVRIEPMRSFEEGDLHPVVLNNIALAKYKQPTPIQAYAIPAVNAGMDVVGVAQTGSGKTAAFMIPILNKLMGKAVTLQAPRYTGPPNEYDARLHATKAEPLVVIVVPTRELALQIFDEARRMCYRSMLRPCVAYGGFPMRDQVDELGRGCDILIGSPGRLCHLMDKPELLTMSRVKYTVIDEADEMLHDNWEDDLRKIMAGGDTNEDADHVYMMFSATFNKEVRAIAREYMSSDYVRIRIGRAGSTHRNVNQTIIEVDHDSKRQAIYDLLLAMKPCKTLIFCNSKKQVDLLDDYLWNAGFLTTSIHSDRSQLVREDAMRSFRAGRVMILIATGISARGWDIPNVKWVINYDLPSAMHGGIDEYIHRIGRTARIGNRGIATSFYNERNEDLSQDLVNVLVESKCEVPEFLQHLVPEDGEAHFDDNSDDENENDEPSHGATSDDINAAFTQDTNGGGVAVDAGFTPDNRFGDAGAVPAAW